MTATQLVSEVDADKQIRSRCDALKAGMKIIAGPLAAGVFGVQAMSFSVLDADVGAGAEEAVTEECVGGEVTVGDHRYHKHRHSHGSVQHRRHNKQSSRREHYQQSTQYTDQSQLSQTSRGSDQSSQSSVVSTLTEALDNRTRRDSGGRNSRRDDGASSRCGGASSRFSYCSQRTGSGYFNPEMSDTSILEQVVLRRREAGSRKRSNSMNSSSRYNQSGYGSSYQQPQRRHSVGSVERPQVIAQGTIKYHDLGQGTYALDQYGRVIIQNSAPVVAQPPFVAQQASQVDLQAQYNAIQNQNMQQSMQMAAAFQQQQQQQQQQLAMEPAKIRLENTMEDVYVDQMNVNQNANQQFVPQQQVPNMFGSVQQAPQQQQFVQQQPTQPSVMQVEQTQAQQALRNQQIMYQQNMSRGNSMAGGEINVQSNMRQSEQVHQAMGGADQQATMSRQNTLMNNPNAAMGQMQMPMGQMPQTAPINHGMSGATGMDEAMYQQQQQQQQGGQYSNVGSVQMGANVNQGAATAQNVQVASTSGHQNASQINMSAAAGGNDVQLKKGLPPLEIHEVFHQIEVDNAGNMAYVAVNGEKVPLGNTVAVPMGAPMGAFVNGPVSSPQVAV